MSDEPIHSADFEFDPTPYMRMGPTRTTVGELLAAMGYVLPPVELPDDAEIEIADVSYCHESVPQSSGEQ